MEHQEKVPERYLCDFLPPYGYANVDGEMVIIPEQAEVVKEIFAECLAGKSTNIIAKELNEKEIPTKKGAKWTGSTINGILTNEKYIGDALFQKTITDANFKRKRNYGEEEQYYCEDHHEPIIDKDTFEKAKESIRQRGLEKGNCTEDTSKYQNRYAMSGKIKCAEQEMLKKRIEEMRQFLQTQSSRVTEYDEQMVRRLIEKITVFDNKLIFEFKSGMTLE